MTNTMTRLPPAGWYRETDDSTVTRWWDGEAWTNRTHILTRRELREQLRSVDTGEVRTVIAPAEYGIVSVAINRTRDSVMTSADDLLHAAGFTPR